jgi:hypothetical protein
MLVAFHDGTVGLPASEIAEDLERLMHVVGSELAPQGVLATADFNSGLWTNRRFPVLIR